MNGDIMRLIEVNETNWIQFANLKVSEDQKKFVAPAIGILARAYAMRKDHAEVLGFEVEDQIVGIALVRNLIDEPACFDLQQFFIDEKYQGRGYGQLALSSIIEILRAKQTFNSVEVCVKNEDLAAIHIYKKIGFEDSGYVDPGAPDSCNLRYRLF